MSVLVTAAVTMAYDLVTTHMDCPFGAGGDHSSKLPMPSRNGLNVSRCYIPVLKLPAPTTGMLGKIKLCKPCISVQTCTGERAVLRHVCRAGAAAAPLRSSLEHGPGPGSLVYARAYAAHA
eukprot:362063-Chlamydomonas_euryale.AAC.2